MNSSNRNLIEFFKRQNTHPIDVPFIYSIINDAFGIHRSFLKKKRKAANLRNTHDQGSFYN